MNIRGIILAGGLSSRMGKNKLELIIKGESIINKVIDNVEKSKLKDIVVVYGRYDIETDLPKVYNPNFKQGMSTSIIEGMKNYSGDAVMVLLGDMPFIDCKIINKLIDAFNVSTKNIVVPIFQGKRGNPVIIGSLYFKELLNNKGDKGAREVIANNPQDVEWVEINSNAIFIDIDSEEDYKVNSMKYGE